MKQLTQRLLVFFIGTPLVVSLALLDFYSHLLLLMVTAVTMVLSAREVHALLRTKLQVQPLLLVLFSISLIHVITIIVIVYNFSSLYIYFTIVFVLMISYAYELFSSNKTDTFTDVVSRICSSAFCIIYIGLFSIFFSQLAFLPNSTIFIATFLLMVFACDSLAWFFGMLFGKGNRGIIKASPNKSIVGFLGGIFGSILAGYLIYSFYPSIFNYKLRFVIITSVFVSIFAILGDLIESAIKRSCAHKDSDIGGVGIPGRGGFLDSIDSLLFSAPIYFIFVTLFFL